MRPCLTLLWMVVFLVAGGRALAQTGPLDPVLDSFAGGDALRPRLFAFADSVAASDPALAAEALSVAGQSFGRGGEVDSAIACFERAMVLDSGEPRRNELAEALLARLGLAPEQAGCMGDDVPDLPVLERCGFACAPRQAHERVRRAAHYVAAAPAGAGAAREVCEYLLRAQGKLDAALARQLA